MLSGKIQAYGVEGYKNGCNFYRIAQPFRKLSQKDYFPCASSSMLKNMDEQTLWTDVSDLIVSQCGTSEKFLEYIRENKRSKKFVLDYDDNIFEISPYNPSYKDHGTRDVRVTFGDGRVSNLWEHGKNGFDILVNQEKMYLFEQTLKAVDLVITPSPILSGVFKKHGARNVRVIKNFVDFETWYPVELVKDDFIRIGYQGGWSHYEDWWEIKDALAEVMKKHKNVLLVIMGQHYEGTLQGIDKSRIVIEKWLNVESYPWKFKTLNIDIGIAPLSNNAFSVCKSEIKWEEYSALKIPCIASNIPPYSLSISNGETGFLASNKEEWIECLGKLIESKELRNAIGNKARDHVKEHYDLDKEIVQYRNAYESLFKPELVIV